MSQDQDPKTEPAQEPTEEKPLWSQLHDQLEAKLGSDWRRNAKLEVRFDELYWFVFLACHGIEARRQAMKKEDKGWFDSAAASMSLASWKRDLEKLVKQIVEAADKPVKPKKARK